MKKFMLLAMSIATIAATANAQLSVRGGLKGGVNLSHSTYKYTVLNTEYKYSGFGPGFYLGGSLEFSSPSGSRLKGQAEALFNFHNAKYNNIESTVQLSQISIPIMLRYFVVPDFSLNGGASVNFNVDGKWKSQNVSSDVNNLNSFQPGLLIGATYYVKKGFFVEGRYNYYFGDYRDNVSTASLGAFQLGIGYKF